MYLKDYIDEYGDDKGLAAKFGVSPRTIKSWRLMERTPCTEIARQIVRLTGGNVDYEGIYAPYKPKKKRGKR